MGWHANCEGVIVRDARVEQRCAEPLLCGSFPALTPGGFVLCGRTALATITAGAGLLATMLRSVRRVCDLGGALLGHALVLQGFVLLLVLDMGGLRRHECSNPRNGR